MLRHLTYVSPNAAECVAMAAAVRRKRRGSGVAGGGAVAAAGAVVEQTQGGSSAGAAESARAVVDRLLPSVQTLLEVTGWPDVRCMGSCAKQQIDLLQRP